MAIKKNTQFFQLLEKYITEVNGEYLIGQLEEKMSALKDYLVAKLEKTYTDKEKLYKFLLKYDKLMSAAEKPPSKFYSNYSIEFIQLLYKQLDMTALTVHDWNRTYNHTDPISHLPLPQRMCIVVDSIIAQIIQYSPPKLSYVGVSEILIEEKCTIHKLIRVVHLLRIIIAKFTKKKQKFLSSILFLIGGRMKIEIINYLNALKEMNKEHLNQYVDQRETNLLRKLSPEEITLCESHLIKEIIEFIASLRTNNNKGVITHLVEENLSNLMREDYSDDYEEITKANPDLIYPLEEAHYIILFCLDTLTFIHLMFAELAECKSKSIEYNSRVAIVNEPVKFVFPSDFQYKFIKPYIHDLIKELCNTIIHVSNSPFAIYNAWYNIFRKNLPVEKKEEGSYQRTQLYNPTGISLLFYYLIANKISPIYPLNYSIGPYSQSYLLSMYSVIIDNLLSKEETCLFGVSCLSFFYRVKYTENHYLHKSISQKMLSFIGGLYNEDTRLVACNMLKLHLSKLSFPSVMSILIEHDKEKSWMIAYLQERMLKEPDEELKYDKMSEYLRKGLEDVSMLESLGGYVQLLKGLLLRDSLGYKARKEEIEKWIMPLATKLKDVKDSTLVSFNLESILLMLKKEEIKK